MVKSAVAPPTGPAVYSATYSNIPVYEYQFGDDLKEHVMRRRHDDWINATHILKAAGYDKPARTRILEREVQKELHEKVQGGYGKYQGTWVPLEKGEELAVRNNVYERVRPIFEFVPGNDSPPPAPKHTTNKPKVPKKPAVPRFNKAAAAAHQRMLDEEMYNESMSQLPDDETPDDTTVASQSFLGDPEEMHDPYLTAQHPGHRQQYHSAGHKRKRSSPGPQDLSPSDLAHTQYSDALLDYFMLAQSDTLSSPPEPPLNFQPDWTIDSEKHTALHWAAAMGDLEVIKTLKRFGASLDARNVRGETPLIRSVLFTNCLERQSMPKVVSELITTIECVDQHGSTALHHAAALTQSRKKHHCARYYIDVILNKMSETMDAESIQRMIDAQDASGDTAVHIAAKNCARKCVRALIGRGASTDIPNHEGIRADEMIRVLNEQRRIASNAANAASSSPFMPESSRRRDRFSFEVVPDEPLTSSNPALRNSQNDGRSNASQRLSNLVASKKGGRSAHISEAANSVSDKVMPLLSDKLMDLAKSFDEELQDKENSQREAKRILQSTNIELSKVQNQLAELEAEGKEDEAMVQNETNQLARTQQHVISLVEQQQALLLAEAIEAAGLEDAPNGTDDHEEDAEMMRQLLQELYDAQKRRQQLVSEYVEALGAAGVGEKAERYRTLTAKCIGVSPEEVDQQLDSLVEVLDEDGKDGDGVEMEM